MRPNHPTAAGLATHQATIEALARESRADPEFVRKLYEDAIAELAANAKVRSFVTVLARRNVRSALLEARAEHRK